MIAAASTETSLSIDWGVAARCLDGQVVSGDLHVVVPLANGALVAAVDGLGHGPEAAEAALIAAETLHKYATEPVTDLIRQCHIALHGSRGAVISIASFDAEHGIMTWIGVGNVVGWLLRASSLSRPSRETLQVRGGVVGFSLPPLRAATLPVFFGDTLIFATDGISDKFTQEALPNLPPEDIADGILHRHGKATDDALVLVARYAGFA